MIDDGGVHNGSVQRRRATAACNGSIKINDVRKGTFSTTWV
ncbi:MAG: hypothetical protein RMJ87_05230 [Cytophagales bacterium]|nr:hypothetical protein [Bernardetiaceae bacterium]MDW8204412.1 hypothetical protein [Cytophagales bacterium]